MITFKKALPRLGIVAGLFFALFLGSGLYFYYKTGPLQEDAVVHIPSGFALGQISARLTEQKIFHSPFLFKMAALLQGKTDQVRAGTYLLPKGISIAQVLSLLTTGAGEMMTLTIPEGLTVYQIVRLLEQEEGVYLNHETLPPEGILLPETYKVAKGISSQQIFRIMRMAMQQAVQTLWEKRAPDLPLKTPEEAMILASIVEKETAISAERPMVAAVYLNRLKKGMLLQADPTTIYALSEAQGFLNRPLLIKDLLLEHAHNTYKNKGLPPTAIANPGYDALKAVLQPAKTKALYFVADGKGGHIFANTLKQHKQNVARYLMVKKRKARRKRKKLATC